MELFSIVADFISIIGAIFALFAWLKARELQKQREQENQHQNRKIQVVLQYGSEKIELPVQLRRAELTRSEILGRLGMIPLKKEGKERFSLKYLNTPEFFRQMNQIIEGRGEGVLTIACTADEFEQFDTTKSNNGFFIHRGGIR